MNAISLPDDPELTEWLSRRAASHGVSPAEEAAAILRAQRAREVPAEQTPDQAPWDALLGAPMPLPDGLTNTSDLIRQMRDAR